jgi:hypothetical protein
VFIIGYDVSSVEIGSRSPAVSNIQVEAKSDRLSNRYYACPTSKLKLKELDHPGRS